ncbi:AbrB/MazE/SpoVT family DNA-binding domain-containing protein [Leptospira santarosai]|uniref:Transcriptional regulator, AbrB family n=2 Tax=Leptospira santarosai TaxID=28183 RepID=A0A0E2BCS0_9LEPT|nr:AbrB/MazE/SpoVT family DNA-binding domain-containing protein [Leptospira santarosai]EMO57011.1 transcriptional regulator, AbrB family [Leptospira santarosai str. CBC1416]EKO33162.1 transcriptional regulator, AbrB family [Leptospira santarosai str. MOR084]EKR92626.1 transcriptional regulator, AbrB family [Leptospira santarosai str. CBC379]EMJ50520.1 transcriptional regulator, AbrB family [Leptospira santarosai str. HAI1349]EMM78551.1 transcriptional regulator, AbrB family [Leptospira santaro
MSKVVISPKFQVVIPKEIREKTGIKVGTYLEVISYGNRIELIPIEPIKKLKGFLNDMDTKIEREKDRI